MTAAPTDRRETGQQAGTKAKQHTAAERIPSPGGTRPPIALDKEPEMSNAHDKHIAPDFSRLKLRLTPEFYSPWGA